MSNYRPQDTLFLWYLGDPDQPKLIGQLHLVMNGRGVSLTYAEPWLRNGFALSEDTPLLAREYLPTHKDLAAGAVNDARPDRWGERVIRHVERPARLSLMEYLYFAGDGRAGALGISTSAEQYQPYSHSPLPTLHDLADLHQLIDRIRLGEAVDEAQRRLIRPGTLGGARPKALMWLDDSEWLVKFPEGPDFAHEPVVEHACMTLAARAGIRVAETRLLQSEAGSALAVKRFDRAHGRRLHTLSADVALRAAGSDTAYPQLAQLLRRRGDAANGLARTHRQELFRRMVFNVLMDNTDDHEKNHALIMTAQHTYELAPAYDVLPAGTALGYQSMSLGDAGAESSVDNALSRAAAFALTPSEAQREAAQVAQVVDQWATHFAACGVPSVEIDRLALAIDRPFLRNQRERLQTHDSA